MLSHLDNLKMGLQCRLQQHEHGEMCQHCQHCSSSCSSSDVNLKSLSVLRGVKQQTAVACSGDTVAAWLLRKPRTIGSKRFLHHCRSTRPDVTRLRDDDDATDDSDSCRGCDASRDHRASSSPGLASREDDTCPRGRWEGGGRGVGSGRTVVSVKSGVPSRRHRRPGDDVHVEDHRRELSMLTVLLALLAIARSKCVPPCARFSLSTVAYVCVAMCLCGGAVAPAVAQLSPMNTDVGLHEEEGVCQSIDIRNNVSNFAKYRHCRVVEGSVQILLIDYADEASYTGISFPELREITGYLMLYRANGLRSVGALFPNLAVIRGHDLILNYAFMSFEMLHLQEIGLHTLTDITRGSVRLEKNPMLCYVNTIDWDKIARNEQNDGNEVIGKSGQFGKNALKGNRMDNECPKCPSVIANETCPRDHTGESHCWNRHFCQKVCPRECPGACDKNGECCDDSCLGGCDSTKPKNADNCFVCKDVKMNGRCIKKCPHGTYEYLHRRCVQESECYKMPVPIDHQNVKSKTTWKPFNGTSCILECPPGFEEKPDRHGRLRCVLCHGLCRKECMGSNVDSIEAAQKLRGCTHINGGLEIQIQGGKNIVKELEENLNMIEEIDHYLKVVRSVPLISLNFLKRLRVIHGKELDSKKYALTVLDNPNLQELWDWGNGTRKMEIRNGTLFFHFNPQLCVDKIKTLNDNVGLPKATEHEVATNSNGDKVACNVSTLHTWVKIKTHSAVVIEWDKFEHHDERTLLGYVVHITQAPYRNLTHYDRRDACGGGGWKVHDVAADQTLQLLTPLKPYTQYAYFVKTYMIAKENRGAQSPIQYFVTNPYVPTVPQSLKVYANSSTELVIKWIPPEKPNGNVTHYIITGTKESDADIPFFGQRNYCAEPVTQLDKLPKHPLHEEEEKTTPNPNSCSCEEKPEKTYDAKEVEWSIRFEDVLHNMIYVKRPSRKRRSTAGSHVKYVDMFDGSLPSTEDNITDPYSFTQVVHNSTIAVIRGLRHYGQYVIAVQACREMTEEEKKSPDVADICSKTSLEAARTLYLEGADNIRQLHFEMSNTSLGTVKLMWDEPPEPNGIIVAYQIEYQQVGRENYNPVPFCITQTQYHNASNSYTLPGTLLPGNYSVRVRATSLAGNGAFTPTVYFQIKEASTSIFMEWMVGCVVGLFAVLVACAVYFFLRRKYLPTMPKGTLIADVNPEYMSTVYVPDEWEVPRKKIELLRELGQGSFGMVYEGIGHDIVDGQREMRCAIKTVGEHATDRERSEFLNEASVMKAFHTHHVVQLLGVVSIDQPVLVVMELMTNGDLKTYLRSHRPDTGGDHSIQPPTLKRILQMAIEIADGMAYLSAKKFVHRDLAARNCMVAEDLTVKIGDFGMTRDIYETDYYRKGTKGLLPVRWMAPESLKDGVFTSRSDVWSYGVVLWEMATLASQPYQGLSNDQVLRYVIEGGVMERPENCPDRLYELMRLCWQHKPLPRPPFLDLVTILLADVASDFSKVSFYHSKEGCEVRAHLAEASAAAEDDPSTPLRITRDIEDFSLGGSDLDDDEGFHVTAHSPSSSYPHRFGIGSATSTQQPLLPDSGDQVVVVLSSNTNKFGNGSAVTSPTAATANGWLANRQQNGGTADSNPTQRTTEC